MPRKVKDELDRKFGFNISVSQRLLDNIDKNVERMQLYLISKGGKESDVKRLVNRSSVVRECVETLGTETGYQSMILGFSLLLDLNTSQVSLFDEELNKPVPKKG